MTSAQGLSMLGIFAEGLMSFFSPCVLPLIPLYMAYLSGDAKSTKPDGSVEYRFKDVFLMTVMFVLGVGATFFILALSISWLREYVRDYANVIGIIGGTIVIILALGQIGILRISLPEWRLFKKIAVGKMGFFKAFLLGFAFSFAWTPCVGPMLTNVLLMALNESQLIGNLYILVYVLGLIIPFLVLGCFTKWGLDLIKKHQNSFKYVMKIAGVVLLIFGCYMIYDNAQKIVTASKTSSNTQQVVYLNDFTFKDQSDRLHALNDHEGEYVFLNMVATWCQYCKQELPEYERFLNDHDLIGYYVMSPVVNNEDVGTILDYYNEHELTHPILIDEDASFFAYVNASAFPTLIVMGPDGSYLGYISGMLGYEQLEQVLTSAIERYEGR